MRGSCILSAGILIVIAGMTTKSLPTERHRIDLFGMAALSALHENQITQLTSPIPPFTPKEEDHPSISSLDHKRDITPHWIIASNSVQCDPLVLPGNRDLKAYLNAENNQKANTQSLASHKHLKAVYPQPISYYLPPKPTPTLVASSRIRRVKLQEVAVTEKPALSIEHLLPSIDQFLASLNPQEQQPEVKPAIETEAENDSVAQETWVQTPYFQKYGYRYVMPEEENQEEPTESSSENQIAQEENLSREIPDFVSNPIDGTIPISATEDTLDESAEDEVEKTMTDSWFGIEVAPLETENGEIGVPDEVTELTPQNQTDSDFDLENYHAYEQRYGSFYKDDYAIEYEAYEEEEPLAEETPGSSDETTGTNETSVPETEPSESPAQDTQEDILSPVINGSFDIYWETTDPNIL